MCCDDRKQNNVRFTIPTLTNKKLKFRDIPGLYFPSRRPEAVGRVDPPWPGRLHRRTESSAQPLLARMVSHHAIPLIQVSGVEIFPRVPAPRRPAPRSSAPRRSCPGLQDHSPSPMSRCWALPGHSVGENGLDGLGGAEHLINHLRNPPRHTSWRAKSRIGPAVGCVSVSPTRDRCPNRADTDILRPAGQAGPAWDISRSIPHPLGLGSEREPHQGRPVDDAIPSHVSHLDLANPNSNSPAPGGG